MKEPQSPADIDPADLEYDEDVLVGREVRPTQLFPRIDKDELLKRLKK